MPDPLGALEAELTHALPVEHHPAVFSAVDKIRAQLGGDRHYIGQKSADRRNSEIIRAVESGESMAEVAKKHGVNRITVWRITRKRSDLL
jgi:Mor family transcriptional regulator